MVLLGRRFLRYSIAESTYRLDQLWKSDDPRLLEAWGIGDREEWTVVNAARIHSLEEPVVPRLVLHFDTLKTHFGEARSPSRDLTLDTLRCARSVRLLLLYCRPETLRGRYSRAVADGDPKKSDRHERVLAMYERPGALRDHYRRFLGFCDDSGIAVDVFDVEDGLPRRSYREALLEACA